MNVSHKAIYTSLFVQAKRDLRPELTRTYGRSGT
jgi:hypothetical protein